jgi:hypothetical protein
MNTRIGGYGDAAIYARVARIAEFENPGPTAQIVDANVIEPDVVQVLATDNEESIPGHGGEMAIAGIGRGHKGIFVDGPREWHPAPRWDVVETDVIQDAETFRVVFSLWLQAQPTKYDDIFVPCQEWSKRDNPVGERLCSQNPALWK